MSKNYLFGLILLGLAWLFAPVSEPPTNQATVAPVIRVRTVIFHMPPEDNIDRTVICGGGGDRDKPWGPTMLAGISAHSC